MGTVNSELLAQLNTAVSNWTAEVGAAQQHLTQQIDGANGQLVRLLSVLQERNGHAAALAEADAEISRLKRALGQDALPAGSVTQFVPDTSPRADAIRKELDTTVDRLQGAVHAWTNEVTQSQDGLREHFDAANSQLSRLLTVLGGGSTNGSAPNASLQAELDQVRHERDLLAAEVRELNIDVEAFRRQQSEFATTNLEAESERDTRHRDEVDALRLAIKERDEIIDECQTLLDDSQRIEGSLNEEIAQLERQVAVFTQSEKQLNDVVAQQRKESGQHVDALAGLTREMESLRQTLGTEADVVTQEAVATDAIAAGDSPSEFMDSLYAQIAALETERDGASVTSDQLRREIEGYAARASTLEEEVNAQHTLIAELESGPDPEAHDTSNESLATPEAEKAELEALQGELDALREVHETLVAGQQESLVSIAHLETERDGAVALANELETLLAQQKTIAEEARDEAAALPPDIEDVAQDLNVDEAAAPAPSTISPKEQRGLESAIAQLEDELNSLQRREEESVAAARLLLQELETHRSFEAAQELSLAEIRRESEQLRQELEEKTRQLQEAEAAHVAALDEAQAQIVPLEQDAPKEATEAASEAAELIARQAADLQEFRDSLQTAEKWIDDLETQLAASESTLAALTADRAASEIEGDEQVALVADLRQEITRLEEALAEKNSALQEKIGALEEMADARDALEQSLEETRNQESELLQERDQFAAALHEASEKTAAQEEDLATAATTLAAQEEALREREEEVQSFRADVQEMSRQLQNLGTEEAEAKQRAATLKEALDGIQASDAYHAEELEQTRAELDTLRANQLQQASLVEELSARGGELENLLQLAHREEIAAQETVESLKADFDSLKEREANESHALDDARAVIESHQEALQAREERVGRLETQLAEVLAEKQALSESKDAQESEIQATMAQVSETIAERDELRDALEKTKDASGRIFVGEAGAGLSALEAAESREQRARQQDILVSELTHTEGGRSLGDILVDANVITHQQLNEAIEIQARDSSQLLGTILIEHDFATDDAIAQAVACQLNKPVVNPMEVHIQPQAISVLNGDICTWHVCIPLRVTSDRLVVVMANPLDESAIYKLRDLSQREITPVVGAASQIMNAIEVHYGSF